MQENTSNNKENANNEDNSSNINDVNNKDNAEDISKKKNTLKKKKILIGVVILAIIILAIIALLFFRKVLNTPTLTLMPPAPLKASNYDEFTVDIKLSDLPSNIYPAASISLTFDKNKLKFTGVKEGTMMTYGDKSADGNNLSIPNWSCNVDRANLNGEINAMYLDTTAGKYAYCSDGFDKKNKNIVLRLGFKLRSSAQKGDVYNITFQDAVFATVNGDKKKDLSCYEYENFKS